ncbi:MAG: NADH:flavin oxidoreductase [Anaerolineae bacterium]|nr:NADH:flavin oxidoreductase [Chloroflexota bacterium]
MPHQPFHYRSLAELIAERDALGLSLALQEDLSPLAQPLCIGDMTAPNRLAIQPMEGCDGTLAGRPDTLTTRRYLRFAGGGAGLLWFEATAIAPEARANPRQLLLTAETEAAFAQLRQRALEEAQRVSGSAFRPFTVIQLAHSGRYSRPGERPAPIIAHHDGLLDQAMGIPADYPLISDEALDRLQETYVEAVRLALQAGFDGVDIKACHRYLISELLAAHTRPGRYGGSFENRTRFLLETVRRVRAEVPQARITLRLNVYDGHPYPWGWGVSREDPAVPDLREPLQLIRLLLEAGVTLVNVTAGNPYYTPHINRPFDQNVIGGYRPQEHPLEGVARILGLARAVKEAVPGMLVLASGVSWLRQYLGNAAVALVAEGAADLVGLGRMAFACPDLPRDLLAGRAPDPDRMCVTCSRCTQIMRDHGRSGCVPFDRTVYAPIYREGRRAARERQA